jgi:hypothetical protein
MATIFVLALVSLSMTAQAQQRAYRLSDRDVEQNIRRLETRADNFKSSLDAALDRSALNGTRSEDEINQYVSEFEKATDQLRDRFSSRRSVAADVENVLQRAASIDNFISNNRLNRRTENDWALVKTELNTLANAYSVAWRWDGRSYPSGTYQTGTTTVVTGSPYRVTDREVDQLIRRIETRADSFRTNVDRALDNSRLDNTRAEDNFNAMIQNFENATDRLRERFNGRNSVAGDVETVLTSASQIDNFIGRRLRNNTGVQSDWSALKTDLNQLANYYNVAWNWNNTPVYGGPVSGANAGLTGTYRLNTATSDDARRVAEQAVRSLPYNQRQTALDAIMARLDTPEMIAIEQNGSNVTIASTRAPQVTLEADGRERIEQYPNGRTSRLRSSISGDNFIVESTGDRAYDFKIVFDPMDNNRLYVTRTVWAENLSRPVTVNSYYTRTSDVAQWNVYGGGSSPVYSGTTTTTGDFIIPNGAQLVAVLNNDLTTKTAADGERFTATVRSPAQYEGATIEGYVSSVKRSGRITGRSEMTLNFERIRMPDGRTYNFAGFVDTVRTANGETVQVNNEGSVREGDSRTTTTATRTAVGTAVGAIIGAIAGGGKGAAIGAAIGAGAGAGSVYVQGRDDLQLLSGTELTITASAPR